MWQTFLSLQSAGIANEDNKTLSAIMSWLLGADNRFYTPFAAQFFPTVQQAPHQVTRLNHSSRFCYSLDVGYEPIKLKWMQNSS
jgi:hypothetical protein